MARCSLKEVGGLSKIRELRWLLLLEKLFYFKQGITVGRHFVYFGKTHCIFKIRHAHIIPAA